MIDWKVIDGSPTAFGPRIDVERREPFYPMRPEDIIRSGSFNHVPFVTGVTTNEAGFVVASQFNALYLFILLLYACTENESE